MGRKGIRKALEVRVINGLSAVMKGLLIMSAKVLRFICHASRFTKVAYGYCSR
jgi:hypothetical protein